MASPAPAVVDRCRPGRKRFYMNAMLSSFPGGNCARSSNYCAFHCLSCHASEKGRVINNARRSNDSWRARGSNNR
eukprot:3686055-Rhodomonas_salina.1